VAKAPHPDWHVRVAEERAPAIVEVLNAQQVWRWLSRAQRHALLAHTAGDRISAHPRVLTALRQRGLLGDTGELTDAGVAVRRWNLPLLPREGA